jgi:hypothetical protein
VDLPRNVIIIILLEMEAGFQGRPDLQFGADPVQSKL